MTTTLAPQLHQVQALQGPPVSLKKPLLNMLPGCASSGSNEPVWECVGHGICGEAGQQVLYGWGRDAPAMTLPPGVGFHVGEGSAIHSLVLQVWTFCGTSTNHSLPRCNLV